MPAHAIDFHVHTRVSPDGLDTPEAVVAQAKRAGLSGIAVTDHDRSQGYRRLVALGLADPSGLPVDGFLVVPGVEVSCVEGHLLVLGATFDAAAGVRARDVIARAHDLGALAVAAHPMDRSRSGMGASAMDRLDLDGVETFNSKTLDRASNRAASRYARARGLAALGGSDAHIRAAVGRAHTRVTCQELSVRSVIGAVAAGRTEVVQGLHTIVEVAHAWARGWLTRPWVFEMCARAAANARRRRVDADPRGQVLSAHH